MYTHSIVWITIPLLSKDKGTVCKVWRLKISQIVAMTGTALSFFICRFFFDSSLHWASKVSALPYKTAYSIFCELNLNIIWQSLMTLRWDIVQCLLTHPFLLPTKWGGKQNYSGNVKGQEALMVYICSSSWLLADLVTSGWEENDCCQSLVNEKNTTIFTQNDNL